MKDKNVAGIMALFLGMFGVHRFYLGQKGLGVLYCCFFFISWFVALIDGILLLTMDQDRFDLKYNWQYFKAEPREPSDFDRTRRKREKEIDKWERRQQERHRGERTSRQATRRQPQMKRERRNPVPTRATTVKQNPYKLSGIKKYKDYDYDGAIEDFLKALEVDDKDIATHFNLACAYSLNEEADQSFKHLDRAVELGFNDFPKIKQHDALAFLRIQPQFEDFANNNYRLITQIASPQDDLLHTPPAGGDLLEQLKKLGELRERGLLTEIEFTVQKKKLLG